VNDGRTLPVVTGMRVAEQQQAPPMRTVLDLMAAGRFGAAEIFVEQNRHRVDAPTRTQWIEALVGHRRALGPGEDTDPIDRLGQAIIRCGWETPRPEGPNRPQRTVG
jgi:hypothetical protein